MAHDCSAINASDPPFTWHFQSRCANEYHVWLGLVHCSCSATVEVPIEVVMYSFDWLPICGLLCEEAKLSMNPHKSTYFLSKLLLLTGTNFSKFNEQCI